LGVKVGIINTAGPKSVHYKQNYFIEKKKMKQNSLALLAPGHYIFATKIELAGMLL
jgi:hypothetical protein